ncbi:MAG: hypothetical protein ACI35S_03640 [Anaeroplasma sp.]
MYFEELNKRKQIKDMEYIKSLNSQNQRLKFVKETIGWEFICDYLKNYYFDEKVTLSDDIDSILESNENDFSKYLYDENSDLYYKVNNIASYYGETILSNREELELKLEQLDDKLYLDAIEDCLQGYNNYGINLK